MLFGYDAQHESNEEFSDDTRFLPKTRTTSISVKTYGLPSQKVQKRDESMTLCLPGRSAEQIKQRWYGGLRRKRMADRQDLELSMAEEETIRQHQIAIAMSNPARRG
jgi:hypothetical protein